MANERFNIEGTRFIFKTNLSGDPNNDRFGDKRRKCNIMVPEGLARELMAKGYKVRETRPREDEDEDNFIPEHFITAILKYEDRQGNPVKYPPKVCLVPEEGAEPVVLDAETVGMIDTIRVKSVDVMLSGYEYDLVNHGMSLYIRTMYVQQDVDDDPYASKYKRNKVNDYGLPFVDDTDPF